MESPLGRHLARLRSPTSSNGTCGRCCIGLRFVQSPVRCPHRMMVIFPAGIPRLRSAWVQERSAVVDLRGREGLPDVSSPMGHPLGLWGVRPAWDDWWPRSRNCSFPRRVGPWLPMRRQAANVGEETSPASTRPTNPTAPSVPSPLRPSRYASAPIVAAQAIPPRAFQSRNRRHGIRSAPASHEVTTRRPGSQRAKNTAAAPRRAKNFSPALDQTLPCHRPATGSVEQPAQPAPTDQIARVVTEDRGRRRDRDHNEKREPPLSSKRAGDDQDSIPQGSRCRPTRREQG